MEIPASYYGPDPYYGVPMRGLSEPEPQIEKGDNFWRFLGMLIFLNMLCSPGYLGVFIISEIISFSPIISILTLFLVLFIITILVVRTEWD